ncbi:tyrosine-type recombinase/integrase [Ruoffia sp. FAM 20858]|uniref:tyrosine-type recombinase/integrase n=2 Tax=unclassified Ruoffia TaxID=2862149 RepID=UPI003884857A
MIEQYKLKNGSVRYKVDYYLGINEYTGKKDRIRQSSFRSYNEAEIFLAREKIKYEENGRHVKLAPKKVKFDDVYRLWFKQYKLTVKEVTYVTLLRSANIHILPNFEGIFINMIDVEKCQDVINDWYSSYTKATMLVSCVNRIFKLAISLNYCNENPMDKVIRPRNTHKEDYEAPFYTKNELKYFFECIKKTENNKKLVMFRLLAFAGLRRGELMALKWKDIDEVNNTLKIERVLAEGINGSVFQSPKNNTSKRTISLDKTTMETLKDWRITQQRELLKLGYNTNKPEQFVFANDENKHLNLYYIGTALTRVLKKHDLPHITTHGFRHTHCSLLFEAGLDMQEVKDRLGHSNIQTTMNVYAHVTQNRRDEVADKFEAFLGF